MRYLALNQILELTKTLGDSDNIEECKEDEFRTENTKEDHPVLISYVSFIFIITYNLCNKENENHPYIETKG